MGYLKKRISGLLLQLLLIFVCTSAVQAQSSSEIKSIFAQAESYYLYEEYELANQLYLLLETPDNFNIKSKIGTCYLNIPGEKEKSIPYLEAAVKSAAYDSKTTSFKEKRAPLDVYFSLAKAYMINNDLEKGMNTLLAFQKLASETKSKGGMENLEYIDQQIQACKTAIKLKEAPVAFIKNPLGTEFSMGSINDNPAVSYDGNTIVYTERRGIVNVIFFSKRERGRWQPPVEITNELNAGEDCSSCSLNSDGSELFLYKTDNYDGAIYSSTYKDGYWTPIKKLNKNINTKFYESHASVSADGKKLYFTSNREGGQGNLDIYVSEKDGLGEWGPAVNLGPTINTPYNEDAPFITQDGNTLYFTSEGHTSMGGYDIFKSQYTASEWKTPENVGYPLNSSDDEKFFQPANNGKNAFVSMTTDYKKQDIMYVTLGWRIKGVLTLQDTTVRQDEKYAVTLIEKKSGDTLGIVKPDTVKRAYDFLIQAGDYTIVYSGTRHLTHKIDTSVFSGHKEPVITLDVELSPDLIARVEPPAEVFDKIDLSVIPVVQSVDSSMMIINLNINDVSDKNINDSEILYFTVQVIALYKPVDVSYFKRINDLKVMYNEEDRFYRYTTGVFKTREEADKWRLELIRRGYPDEIFIKKVSK